MSNVPLLLPILDPMGRQNDGRLFAPNVYINRRDVDQRGSVTGHLGSNRRRAILQTLSSGKLRQTLEALMSPDELGEDEGRKEEKTDMK